MKGSVNNNVDWAGFTVVDEGLKAPGNPSEEHRARCLEYGRKLAAALARGHGAPSNGRGGNPCA